MDLTAEEVDLRDRLIAESDATGNAIVEVAAEDGEGPCTFSVGAWRRFGVPEGITVGLPPEAGRHLVNTYVRRAAAGKKYIPGVRYHDFFDGVPITFERVAKGHYFPYLGTAFLLHPAGDFPAVQLIVPTAALVWPWDEHAPPDFARWQPILTVSGRPESWVPGVNGP
ncbi:DUF4262 domain-containing protein [Actinophytocola sediminis]